VKHHSQVQSFRPKKWLIPLGKTLEVVSLLKSIKGEKRKASLWEEFDKDDSDQPILPGEETSI